MFKTLFHIAIFSALFLSACGGVTTVPPTTSEPVKGSLPTLAGSWTITMTHSGGIMGLSRSVEIDSTGIYIVKEDRTDQDFTGQLSEEELADLMYVVNSTSYEEKKRPRGCADCFVYNLQIMSDTGRFSAQVDDTSIEESGLSALIMTLRGIIEREIK
jgi:hypothetical protein